MTQEYLKSLLSYDPDTGHFTWINRRFHIKAGARAGCADHRGYIFIGIDGKLYTAHRLAVFYVTGTWPPRDTDHRNRDKSDNRWDNIRVATRTQNNGNRKASNRLKGASQKPNGRWMAQIVHDKTHYYLGLHDTAEQAHEAYRRMAVKLYGEFARFE
jgi:hypothetical protein